MHSNATTSLLRDCFWVVSDCFWSLVVLTGVIRGIWWMVRDSDCPDAVEMDDYTDRF